MAFDRDLTAELIDYIDSRRVSSLRGFAALLGREDIRLRFGTPRRLGADEAILAAFQCRPPEQEMIWGISQDGSLAGVVNCALVSPGEMEIGLIVRSDLKRKGIGSWLLEVAKRRALHRQMDKVIGTILWENSAMRSLARKSGFVAAGTYGLMIDMEIVLCSDAKNPEAAIH